MIRSVRLVAGITAVISAALVFSGCGAAAKNSGSTSTPAAASNLSTAVSNAGTARSGAGTAAASAAAGGTSIKGKVVVDLLPSYDNSWMAAYGKAFESQGKTLGLDVKTQTNNFDAAVQSQQIDDAIAQKVALINILPTNETAELPALRRAKAANIPVIITTSPLRPGHDDLFAAYYGPNHATLGELAAKSVCTALSTDGRKGGKIALITGAQVFYEAVIRIDAFDAQIKKCSVPISIVSTQDGQWATNISEQQASQLFAKYQGSNALSAIYAMADNQADGVITAAKQAGIPVGLGPKDLIVVGSNCTTEGVANIGSGLQLSTNTQMASVDGKANADLVGKYLSGAAVPKNTYDESTLITKANLAKYAKGCTT